jgi:uracil-DNA glycosylase
MSEEFDFGELRNYLRGQIDLGDAELFLDEPWALTRGKTRPAPARPAPVRPAVAPAASVAPVSNEISEMFDNSGLFGAPAPAAAPSREPVAVAAPLAPPAPRAVKKTVAEYESADSLDSFYTSLKKDVLYAHAADLPRYAGPQNPRLLFVLPAQQPGEDCAKFLQGAPGEMLVRLFANLNVDASAIGVTYFFKGAPRPISPLLETSLRKMLAKEIALIQPQLVVTFGEPLFYQVFGKAKPFADMAGSDLEFGGAPAMALADPYTMVNDKQLKWLTWKVHIPRSSRFPKT